jgi:transcriptional regulator with XRE-family HTH domain
MDIKEIKINNEIFKVKREEKSLTVREVEEISGVSRSTVSNVENGVNIPDGHNLLRLMFLYGLSKEEISLAE